MPKILIAGCGYVGTATADLFHAAGWLVEAWVRSPDSVAHLSGKPYPVRTIDLADRTAVAQSGRGFDAVIQSASTSGGGAESYRRVYLAGAKNLLELLAPARFIFMSSTSVYAQTNGEWVDETSPAEPEHETGKILREAENLVRGTGGTVARLAGIYGPGRSALLRKFLSGEARLEDGGGRWQNQAHRDDIAAALFLLATLPNETGIVNVSDNETLTQRDCYEWLAAKLHRPLPPVVEQAKPRKRGTSNKRISNRKLRGLGWIPRFPDFRIGMEESVLPAHSTLGA
jgi:nucleoside-diphosphate-sugar epimerase